MKVNIGEKSENKLLKRKEIKFTVDHDKEATPKRNDLRNTIAALLGSAPGVVIIAGMKTSFGTGRTIGIAHVYSDENALKAIEPKHILKRFGMEKKEEVKAEVKE